MDVFKSKKTAMKFMIMRELAFFTPTPNQKEIAEKLGVTPQAISEYFRELINDGFITVKGRGDYEITGKGLDWLSHRARELFRFSEDTFKRIISKTPVIVAISKDRLTEGDTVELTVEDGIVYAYFSEKGSCRALTSGNFGDEIAVKPSSPEISLKKGEVIIVKVPDAIEGGSRKLNLKKLKKLVNENKDLFCAAFGVESLVALRKVGIEPIFFGSRETVVEAAHHGVSSIFLCVESGLPGVIKRLEEENIQFTIVNM